jgi:hypothetical protein
MPGSLGSWARSKGTARQPGVAPDAPPAQLLPIGLMLVLAAAGLLLRRRSLAVGRDITLLVRTVRSTATRRPGGAATPRSTSG